MQEFSLQQWDQYRDNTEIVHLTAKQIGKDFAMFGMEISFSGNTAAAYAELMFQLTNHLQVLLNNDQERLFALMYQIDISQASVNACFGIQEHPATLLADLIIRREMMKVLTVIYFRKQKNLL